MSILIISILRLSSIICEYNRLLCITYYSALDDVLFKLQKVIISRLLVRDQRNTRENVVHDAKMKNFCI